MRKITMFIGQRKTDFYFERYERSEDLKTWCLVPEIVNFEKLPMSLKVELPREEYLIKQKAAFVMEEPTGNKTKKFHTGLRQTPYPNLYHGNKLETKNKEDKPKTSEILVLFANSNRTMFVAYFNLFRVVPFDYKAFYEGFMAKYWNMNLK